MYNHHTERKHNTEKNKRAITNQIQRYKIQLFNTVSIVHYVISNYVPPQLIQEYAVPESLEPISK